jgi:hypothetical protein
VIRGVGRGWGRGRGDCNKNQCNSTATNRELAIALRVIAVIHMMSSLHEEITALKTEIKEYRVLSRVAETSEERKDKLFDAITASRNTVL